MSRTQLREGLKMEIDLIWQRIYGGGWDTIIVQGSSIIHKLDLKAT